MDGQIPARPDASPARRWLAIERAFADPALKPRDLHVLAAVLVRLNRRTGICYPSLATLAKDAGLKQRTTVGASITRLVVGGHLGRLSGDAKLQTANTYWLPEFPVSLEANSPISLEANSLSATAAASARVPVSLEAEPTQELEERATQKAEEAANAAHLSFREFMDRCKEAGEDAIPEDHPVFAWAGNAGIPRDGLDGAWREFSLRYGRNSQRKRSGTVAQWRDFFWEDVRSNEYRLWFYDEKAGKFCLSTKGRAQLRAANKVGARATPKVLST
jgi:hypothetical protein